MEQYSTHHLRPKWISDCTSSTIWGRNCLTQKLWIRMQHVSLWPARFNTSHVVFGTVKENGVAMPELLQSVYISWHLFNFEVLIAKSLVPFNWLIFNFYEELLDEWQFVSKSDDSVHEETHGCCYSLTRTWLEFQQIFFLSK